MMFTAALIGKLLVELGYSEHFLREVCRECFPTRENSQYCVVYARELSWSTFTECSRGRDITIMFIDAVLTLFRTYNVSWVDCRFKDVDFYHFLVAAATLHDFITGERLGYLYPPEEVLAEVDFDYLKPFLRSMRGNCWCNLVCYWRNLVNIKTQFEIYKFKFAMCSTIIQYKFMHALNPSTHTADAFSANLPKPWEPQLSLVQDDNEKEKRPALIAKMYSQQERKSLELRGYLLQFWIGLETL